MSSESEDLDEVASDCAEGAISMRSQLPQILLQAFEADSLFRAATTVSGEVEGFGAIGKC